VLVTCEHAGARVPARYRRLFEGKKRLLLCHRGWDRGSLALARALAGGLGAPLIAHGITRLLVDPNRSPHNPRRFSEVTAGLAPRERAALERRYHEPHRARVREAVRRGMASGRSALHVSVHTFAPVLKGRTRRADLGLLYDPARKAEALLCRRWREALKALAPGLRVRMNYPYRGTSDGLTTSLRKVFPQGYLGIEIEVNQKFTHRGRMDEIGAALLEGLIRAIRAEERQGAPPPR